MRLNYHHLRYFQEVALEGNLTRAASRLNVSQSALSTQIRQLEERLGHALFERTGRSMALTEAGQIALDHAERIFDVGDDLVATLSMGGDAKPPLRVGALSTLSRNFQLRVVRPALSEDFDLVLASGSRQTLLPDRLAHETLADLLRAEPVILPTESSIRTGFDSLVARLGITPRIAATVDDMAMVRLLAREGLGLAVTPAVVLADELAQGMLATAPFELDVIESFYAVTAPRTFPHPLLARLSEPLTDRDPV
mgnify:CR=1 FL=1